jgi:cytochrome c
MRSLKPVLAAAAALGLAGSVLAHTDMSRPRVGFGQPISPADLAAWDIDVSTSDGKGLPPGKGSVAEGKAIYAQKCVACHGEAGNGGPQYPGKLYGGIGSFTTKARILTPGSMYPYAPILFDYTRRTMPMDSPQTLTNDQVYALSAYILNLNGLVKEDAVLDANSLAAIKMPNRDGFIVDDRPDVKAVRCMKDCP